MRIIRHRVRKDDGTPYDSDSSPNRGGKKPRFCSDHPSPEICRRMSWATQKGGNNG